MSQQAAAVQMPNPPDRADDKPLSLEELLEEMLLALVRNRKVLQVDRRDEDDNITLTIQADAKDYGRIIGREGVILQAVRRYFAHLAAAKGKKSFIVLPPKTKTAPIEDATDLDEDP